ncbi:unnamed protein product, partial [Adineta steineri]
DICIDNNNIRKKSSVSSDESVNAR